MTAYTLFTREQGGIFQTSTNRYSASKTVPHALKSALTALIPWQVLPINRVGVTHLHSVQLCHQFSVGVFGLMSIHNSTCLFSESFPWYSNPSPAIPASGNLISANPNGELPVKAQHLHYLGPNLFNAYLVFSIVRITLSTKALVNSGYMVAHIRGTDSNLLSKLCQPRTSSNTTSSNTQAENMETKERFRALVFTAPCTVS